LFCFFFFFFFLFLIIQSQAAFVNCLYVARFTIVHSKTQIKFPLLLLLLLLLLLFYYYFGLVSFCFLLMQECFCLLLLFISGTKTWKALSKTKLQQQRGNIVLKLNVTQSNQGEWFCLFLFARHEWALKLIISQLNLKFVFPLFTSSSCFIIFTG